MQPNIDPDSVVTAINLMEFFRDALRGVLADQRVAVEEQTEHYVRFARRLVDVDYHIAMGGRAYDTLARSLEHSRRRAPARVFAELAAKFQPLVDALSEIGDTAYVYTQRDILRLYEIWLKTGSMRARRLLRRLGVEAAPVAMRTH
jgi:hypothetical protein